MILPRALLFDLDGTLVDSLPDLTEALNRTLAGAGLAPLSVAEASGLVGDGAAAMLARGFALRDRAADAQRLEQFLAHYALCLTDKTRPFAQVPETLKQLRNEGWRLAVATNKPESLAKRLLQNLGLDRHFDHVAGGDSYPRRKPDPLPLLESLKILGCDQGRSVMVGDSRNDLLAARAAGLPVILVSFGYTSVPAAELGADKVIERFADLPGALNLLRTW